MHQNSTLICLPAFWCILIDMYASRLEEAEGILLSVLWGKNSPEDFDRYEAQWERLDKIGLTRADGTALHIVAFHHIVERPDATQRKRVADMRRRTKTPHPIGALVSESVVARGLLRVIQWIAPPPPHFRLGVFESFEESAQWAEAQMKRSLPMIRGLYQEALFEAQKL
jgi:hypothetical protein